MEEAKVCYRSTRQETVLSVYLKSYHAEMKSSDLSVMGLGIHICYTSSERLHYAGIFLGLRDAGLAPQNLKWPLEPNIKEPSPPPSPENVK